MSETIIRIQIKSPLQTIYSFISLPGVKEKQSFESVYSQIKGIDLSGPFYFGECFRMPSRA